jgi:dTDP-4-amino-4,6-dideoxygalactose transaminase
MNIPFSPPYIDHTVVKEVKSCLNSGWITTGSKVKALEEAIGEYTETKNVLCVNSWTSGAILILKWFGIKEGDEVIIPAYTYSATALAVLHCGAKPVMVDVGEDFIVSPDSIRKAITSRTKAIIPVDFAGWPCNYEAISDLVNQEEIRACFHPESEIQTLLKRIIVIADAAHSFGATRKSKPAISKCDIGIFSLHAVKNLTTGEGGAICINMPEPFDNSQVYSYLRMMALNGQTKDAFSKSTAGGWKYDIVMQGLKINMPDICAAIGLAQIRKYDYLQSKRQNISMLYSKLLGKYDWAQLPPQDDQNQVSSFHLYALRINGISEKERDLMIDRMTKYGIAVNVHFIPLPALSYFRGLGYKIEDFPVSYDNYSREISLPIYPQLTLKNVRKIVDCIIQSYHSIKND